MSQDVALAGLWKLLSVDMLAESLTTYLVLRKDGVRANLPTLLGVFGRENAVYQR